MNGVIMDINGDEAVVFYKNGVVSEIKNRNYKVGQKIKVHTVPYKKHLAIAACLFICLFTGFTGITAYNTPVSYIYVDINPSIRLDINTFDRVISIIPLNDDASTLMASYDFHSKDTNKCIQSIVSACREKKYISIENNSIELDVITTKEGLRKKVDVVSKMLKNEKLDITVQELSGEENERAMKLEISPKHLKAIEQYTKVYGGSVDDNLAKLKNTSVKDIYSEAQKGSVKPANEEARGNENLSDIKDKPAPANKSNPSSEIKDIPKEKNEKKNLPDNKDKSEERNSSSDKGNETTLKPNVDKPTSDESSNPPDNEKKHLPGQEKNTKENKSNLKTE